MIFISFNRGGRERERKEERAADRHPFPPVPSSPGPDWRTVPNRLRRGSFSLPPIHQPTNQIRCRKLNINWRHRQQIHHRDRPTHQRRGQKFNRQPTPVVVVIVGAGGGWGALMKLLRRSENNREQGKEQQLEEEGRKSQVAWGSANPPL